MWSAIGSGLPLLAALVAVPILMAKLGLAKFGFLSLAWIFVGYCSLFDFGLGQAMTRMIACRRADGNETELLQIVRAGLWALVVLGFVGSVFLLSFSHLLVGEILRIPPDLQDEALTAFRVLSIAIPLVIWTTALRGVLEGFQRFDLANLVRAPAGALTYFFPLIAVLFSTSLVFVVASLVLARLFSLLAFSLVVIRLLPTTNARPLPSARVLKQLFFFGGWMTVSNVAAPLLLYAGRFILAAEASMEAVAYFSTSYDIVINLLLIPGIAVSVLFPDFTRMIQADPPVAAALYRQSMLQMAMILLPVCTICALIAHPALSWWVGREFADQSYITAQCLIAGAFINSFGHIAQSFVQAYGRPDLTAKLHLFELLIYIPYAVWLIKNYGAIGAAVSWAVRVTISTLVLSLLADGCIKRKIKKPNEALA